MSTKEKLGKILKENNGVLRLKPIFVPRRFGAAGRRLRLHPDDYFALGTKRGSIKERWFSSIIPAMNGPLAAPDEGMSYVCTGDEQILRAAEQLLYDELAAVWSIEPAQVLPRLIERIEKGENPE